MVALRQAATRRASGNSSGPAAVSAAGLQSDSIDFTGVGFAVDVPPFSL